MLFFTGLNTICMFAALGFYAYVNPEPSLLATGIANGFVMLLCKPNQE